MKPLPWVWPYALPFWLIFVWAFWPEFMIIRRARRNATETGKSDRSMSVIIMGMWVAMMIAFPLAWVRPLRFPPAAALTVFWLGTAMILLGSLLRRHCWRMLGASFTGNVKAHAGQAIVTRGAYAFLRHPSYTAGIIMNTGIGLALGSWASTLLVAAASFAVYAYRMAVEERTLLDVIGDPYREFCRTRRRLIPFIY